MSDQVRQDALRSRTQQLLQGPLKHVKAAALAAALVPLAVVAVRSSAPDGLCAASAGACGFVFVDTNGNGIQDAGEQPYGVWTDANHNGTIDVEWVDANANGHVDGQDEWVDVNHNGVLDANEWIDLNNDGVLDKGEGWVDFNGNGIVDAGEWIDINHNGVLDANEWIDLNGNGAPDAGEGWVDFNGDDTFTKSEWTDLNGNGVVDASEWQGAVVTLTQTDCVTDCITLTTSTDQYGQVRIPRTDGTFTVSVQIPPRIHGVTVQQSRRAGRDVRQRRRAERRGDVERGGGSARFPDPRRSSTSGSSRRSMRPTMPGRSCTAAGAGRA